MKKFFISTILLSFNLLSRHWEFQELPHELKIIMLKKSCNTDLKDINSIIQSLNTLDTFAKISKHCSLDCLIYGEIALDFEK